MNKDILRDLSYGVYVISSKKDKRDVGCIANSVMQITSNPVTLAISINVDNFTNQAIKESEEFVCMVLPNDIDNNVIGTFGFKTSAEVDKFEKMDTVEIDGYPILKDAIGYMRCKLIKQVDMNTHTIFVGEVISSDKLNTKEPMTYAYYHQVKKGKSPAKAPTYIEEEVSGKKRYVCPICGYVYEEGEMPDDFVCPICGAPKKVFKEVS